MKIAFLGDLVVDRQVAVDSEVSQFLKEADVVIGNIEGIILQQGFFPGPFKTYGSIIHNDYDAIMRLISKVGITHVNLYNNHMIDYGEEHFNRTVEILECAGIKILACENEFSLNGEKIKLSNSGLAETFGIYEISEKFGQNINDMLFTKNPLEKWNNSIIYTHFGIEQVKGLSRYESQWFQTIAKFSPKIIIRHHPHCIQDFFLLNGVPCFPSIGDFVFNYKKKTTSEGLIVLFNTLDSDIQCRIVKCAHYHLRFVAKDFNLCTQSSPVFLSDYERSELKHRYLREYREGGFESLRKSVKYFLGKEKSEHVLSMSSKHFMQPYVLGELL